LIEEGSTYGGRILAIIYPSIYYILNLSELPAIAQIPLLLLMSTQILLITPYLAKLSLQMRKYNAWLNKSTLLQQAALAAMNYVFAICATYAFKWAEMTARKGSCWFISYLRNIGALNTAATLTLSPIFAVKAA
jgi:hypothetical protein